MISEAATMQARDIMTTNVVSISPVVSVRHAVAMMLQNHVSGLPVVDDHDRICGMVTEGDLLLRREVRFSPRPRGAGADIRDRPRTLHWQQRMVCGGCHVPGRHRRPARQRSLRYCRKLAGAPYQAAADRRRERLVGIVSRRDILRVIAEAPTNVLPRGDEAITLAARTRLRSDLGLTPQKVQVSVRNGQVTVDGHVESELKRRAIKVLIEGLGGIAGYKDCLLVSPVHNLD